MLARLGISRDTIHRWIRAGDFGRDFDSAPVRPRRPLPNEARCLKGAHSRAARGVSSALGCGLLEEFRAAGYGAAVGDLLELRLSFRRDPREIVSVGKILL